MVVHIALGIVLGVATLFLIVIIGPWLLETVAEFIGDKVVRWVATVAGLITAVQWVGREHEWDWILVAVSVGMVMAGVTFAAIGALVLDTLTRMQEYRGKPTRWVRLELERRRALGYDVCSTL